MKKLFLLAAMGGVVALTSCGGSGNSNGNNADSSNAIESSVHNAADAVKNGADSLGSDVKNGADSLKNDVDSLTDGE